VAKKRSGKQFDPGLVKLFCQDAGDLLAGLEDRVLDVACGTGIVR
jgi:hypothetical protein